MSQIGVQLSRKRAACSVCRLRCDVRVSVGSCRCSVHARHGILRMHFCALPRVAPRTSCVTSICMVQEGWTKVCGDDVGNLHFEYYPQPEDHGTYGKVL